MIWLQLFFEFFKTGLFAVGGGLATLPFIYEIGSRTGWFTAADVADMIAVSESTPGPMGVNMATYTGYKVAGIFGGAWTTLGLIFPSIVIIILISHVLRKFRDSKIVERIFYGLRPASTGLIAAAGIGVAKISLFHTEVLEKSGLVAELFNWRCILLAAVIYITYKKVKHSPIFYIFAAAMIGIIFQL